MDSVIRAPHSNISPPIDSQTPPHPRMRDERCPGGTRRESRPPKGKAAANLAGGVQARSEQDSGDDREDGCQSGGPTAWERGVGSIGGAGGGQRTARDDEAQGAEQAKGDRAAARHGEEGSHGSFRGNDGGHD